MGVCTLGPPYSYSSYSCATPIGKARSNFFKTFKRKKRYNEKVLKMRDEAGIENELLEKVGNLNFKNQVEAFYTAYSKVCLPSPSLRVPYIHLSMLT